ncbi:MAG: haloacid dehalogenase [Deltaproteobacteria bacterium]|nr:haloacid dehalogenase [Deltaproteobacteria bacterium]
MVTPDNIAFDIDGVLANTMGLFLEIARKDFGINHIRYENITEYFLEDCLDMEPDIIRLIINRILEGDVSYKLKPLEGAVDVLSEIGQIHPLLFVTARPQLEVIQEWVRRILPLIPSKIEVIATGTFEGKGEVLDARGIGYFVEDFLDICYMISERDIKPILFSQPWNRSPNHPFKEVGSWAEIRALIDFQGS